MSSAVTLYFLGLNTVAIGCTCFRGGWVLYHIYVKKLKGRGTYCHYITILKNKNHLKSWIFYLFIFISTGCHNKCCNSYFKSEFVFLSKSKAWFAQAWRRLPYLTLGLCWCGHGCSPLKPSPGSAVDRKLPCTSLAPANRAIPHAVGVCWDQQDPWEWEEGVCFWFLAAQVTLDSHFCCPDSRWHCTPGFLP